MAVIPNVITHGLMALDVYNKLETSEVQMAISNHPRAYLLGSNGPDILFYYKVFPWENQELNQIIAKIGNEVHSTHINEFYTYAIALIHDIKDENRRQILLAYLAGHLMHWSLDSLAHPFVFYRSGEIDGPTRYWHYRYESMIDALMLAYVKRKDMRTVKVKRFLDVSDEERRAIASFYQMILAEVFDVVISPSVIDDAIVTMKRAVELLYDPKNIKTPVIKKFENQFLEPWQLSSHIVNSQLDSEHDILNLRHEAWSNPTDINDVSTLSFVDLYDYSIKLGQLLIDRFDAILKGDFDNFDDIIQDCQYDTGRPVGVEMKYYGNIYQD